MEEENKKEDRIEKDDSDEPKKDTLTDIPQRAHQGGARTSPRQEPAIQTSKETEESLSEEGKKDIKKELSNTQNKQLKLILIIFGGLILIFLLGFSMVDSIRNFEYKDVKFEIVKEGGMIFYKTAFPIYSSITGRHVLNYNIYLRNDPRELKEIPYQGGIALNTPLKKMVIDLEQDFHCEGYGIIAMANFVKSFDLIGIEVVKDPEVGCDEEGRYNYVRLQEGNETSISQDRRRCYTINIKDCEILEGTERFIVEAFADFDEKIYYNPGE